VYEKKLSDEELVKKAVKLQLPPNFFEFENAEPKCPGCRGCDDDWDWHTGE
jgi:hypothetical protein